MSQRERERERERERSVSSIVSEDDADYIFN